MPEEDVKPNLEVERQPYMDKPVYSPNAMTDMRACLNCRVIQTKAQFFQLGCPNCRDFLRMQENEGRIAACTTTSFHGFIANIRPGAFVTRYLGLEKRPPGFYALTVNGSIPDEILHESEDDMDDFLADKPAASTHVELGVRNPEIAEALDEALDDALEQPAAAPSEVRDPEIAKEQADDDELDLLEGRPVKRAKVEAPEEEAAPASSSLPTPELPTADTVPPTADIEPATNAGDAVLGDGEEEPVESEVFSLGIPEEVPSRESAKEEREPVLPPEPDAEFS